MEIGDKGDIQSASQKVDANIRSSVHLRKRGCGLATGSDIANDSADSVLIRKKEQANDVMSRIEYDSAVFRADRDRLYGSQLSGDFGGRISTQ